MPLKVEWLRCVGVTGILQVLSSTLAFTGQQTQAPTRQG